MNDMCLSLVSLEDSSGRRNQTMRPKTKRQYKNESKEVCTCSRNTVGNGKQCYFPGYKL